MLNVNNIILRLTLRDIVSQSSVFSELFSYAFPTLATKSFIVSHRILGNMKKKCFWYNIYIYISVLFLFAFKFYSLLYQHILHTVPVYTYSELCGKPLFERHVTFPVA